MKLGQQYIKFISFVRLQQHLHYSAILRRTHKIKLRLLKVTGNATNERTIMTSYYL